jgi:hypothetical protein
VDLVTHNLNLTLLPLKYEAKYKLYAKYLHIVWHRCLTPKELSWLLISGRRGQGELMYIVELVLLKQTYSVQVRKQTVIPVMPTALSSIIQSWLLHGYVESIPRFLWLCFTHIWMRRLPGQNGKLPHKNNMSGLSLYWQTIWLENSDQQGLISWAPSFFFPEVPQLYVEEMNRYY